MTHTSVLVRRRARRLSEEARATLDRPPVADDGRPAPRTTVVGRDPLRILLFGSGPLIGYGVRHRHDAADGPLASILATTTGRGVIIESRVRLALPVSDAVDSLGGAGAVTFHAAVWAPRFGEELRYSDPERARGSVRTMLGQFRRRSPIPLVLCHLPVPEGTDWRSTLRRPRIATFNRILVDEAGKTAGVHSVDIGSYVPTDRASTPASWHHAVAERLATTVLVAIGVGPGSR